MTGRRTHDAILTAPSTVYPGGSINERERERGGCVLERVVCRVRFARVSCPWLRFNLPGTDSWSDSSALSSHHTA
jgi:hypothetical protein